ncbi:oxidoreductase [Desulfopila inferna]|uniref:oxidoreductase n=1 Tax=Desulfopila inferna TaxID=468528 RepID=UPI0019625E07|nr:FAD-dependent oxidoreductase [Desulfopila inferna]MBM9603498.1 FAD-dependent oxidoreductase [Desulfopila inferna]
MIDPLFQPITIGSLLVKNRIFMPAMHMNMCHNSMVTEQLLEFYRKRAEGGAGLISVGYATVDRLSGNRGNIGAHDDSFLPGLQELAAVIHSGGAAAAVQLNHAGRYNHSFFLGGQKPVAPSAIASRLTRETPREMEAEDIAAVQQSFADAAQRVVNAGFDMVEILAGTGYLISEFLSPLTNKRHDQYGGSLENRLRFGLEIIRSVRSQIGDFPLLVRINGNDFMEGGSSRDELQYFGVKLAEAGVDALCINVGWHEAQIPQIVTKVPRGVFAYMAREMKKQVAVPVIASHRINDPQTGRRLIAEGYCDLVAMGRALIADAELPNKARKGEERKILHCVACGQGCFDNLIKMKAVECLCNPLAGHEQDLNFTTTALPRKVMVVGGGPGGINAALAAAAKGHEVTLYEKDMQLGGQLRLAGASPGRREFLVLADDLTAKLADSTVRVILNTEVDGALLLEEKPHTVIVASGGTPIFPVIEGADMDHVVQAWDVLKKKWVPGENIVIIGGGAVGVETALMVAEQGTLSGEELKFLLVNGAESLNAMMELALQGSKKVTLIELQDKLGNNFGRSTRWSMLQDVQRFGVNTRVESRVIRIEKDGVLIEKGGKEEMIPADTVILAVGTLPDNSLQKAAKELNIFCTVIGDASKPATVLEATHHGFRAGLEIV